MDPPTSSHTLPFFQSFSAAVAHHFFPFFPNRLNNLVFLEHPAAVPAESFRTHYVGVCCEGDTCRFFPVGTTTRILQAPLERKKKNPSKSPSSALLQHTFEQHFVFLPEELGPTEKKPSTVGSGYCGGFPPSRKNRYLNFLFNMQKVAAAASAVATTPL